MVKEKQRHILVIDDSQTDREIFRQFLVKEGFRITAVTSVQEGFDVLKKEHVDIIVCDYYMPNETGGDFIKKLRQDPELAHHVVIIVTSDEGRDIRVDLLNKGANDFIQKGSAQQEIVARVYAHLKAREASESRTTLQYAGAYTHEISEPLSAMIASVDLLKEKATDLHPPHQDEINEIVTTMEVSIKRITELVEKIRVLEMDTVKHYTKDEPMFF